MQLNPNRQPDGGVWVVESARHPIYHHHEAVERVVDPLECGRAALGSGAGFNLSG